MSNRSITTEKWLDRQSVVRLLPNGHWEVSFLATSAGSITSLGGQVAEYETTNSGDAKIAMFAWVTSGIVPSGFKTHAPDWFKEA